MSCGFPTETGSMSTTFTTDQRKAGSVRDARAQSVSVVVTQAADTVRGVVGDDVDGYASDRVRDGALGLVGMRERLAVLGGRLDVQSTPGRATTLVAELPLPGA